jgi:hypothetical protein
MSGRLKKLLLLTLAAALLAGVFFLQGSMNDDREQLGLTRMQPLENAPPVLAFTTVALGGFRGLISNMLWIRAGDLQEQDKFFEMAQLADWITKLEPQYVQVWLVQAWNMAYNISVKFTDFSDRWRWVQRGIELLRDQGLPANQNAVLMYRELAWFFQHKMGANLDDANMYYKQQWANEMATVFGKVKKPDLDELINPQTDDQKARARLLREKFKMDPVFMKEVDQLDGPLEWRLPEAHAIYWAALGLKIAKDNPAKVKEQDLITLRRVIYQSMQLSFYRGRLINNPFAKAFEFGPNLDIIPKVSAAYEQAAAEDAAYHDHILQAHKNFLKDAIYFLYEYNRISEAARWYKYFAQQYPDADVLDYTTPGASLARNISLDRYCLSRIQEDVDGTPRDRIEATIEGQIMTAYRCLAIDEDEHAAGCKLLAHKLWENFMSRLPEDRKKAVGLRPFEEIDREMLRRILDREHGAAPEIRAILLTKLGIKAETVLGPAAATNAPPEKPQE